MPGVTGRVALVTGASQGIGRACALALAEGGAIIALAARNEDKLAAVAKEIESKGAQAATFRMDVSNEADVKSAVKAAIERFGKIEILVNNAGVTRDTLLMRMKKEDWDSVIQTNLSGAFYTTQAVIGSMLTNRVNSPTWSLRRRATLSRPFTRSSSTDTPSQMFSGTPRLP